MGVRIPKSARYKNQFGGAMKHLLLTTIAAVLLVVLLGAS